MTRTLTLMLLAALSACAAPIQGDWELEVVDTDDCGMTLELDRQGDDLEGDAELDCTLYGVFYDEYYAVEYDDDDGEAEGDLDGDDFELEVTFYDGDIEFELEGEVEGDEMHGDVFLDGEFWAEFEGSRDGSRGLSL